MYFPRKLAVSMWAYGEITNAVAIAADANRGRNSTNRCGLSGAFGGFEGSGEAEPSGASVVDDGED